MDLVIGSGPSGVSVATALLARGRTVTMLDCGQHMPEEAQNLRDSLARDTPDNWDPAMVAAYQNAQFDTPPGQVRRFGSDFAMEPKSSTFSNDSDPIGLRASRAAGGLSNLWGAAVLPYCQTDISDWPVTSDELHAHYQSVASFVPISGKSDGLDRLFPTMDMAGSTQIPATVQADALLKRMNRHRDWIMARGMTFGAARQAVSSDCQHCGLCLHGCPWGYIYSAHQTLAKLTQIPNFSYRSGTAVRGFTETADCVQISLSSGETVSGTRLFIAAGVLETARIFLASQKGSTSSLTLKDSQHAFLPMLSRWRPDRRPDRRPFHTLPQAFLEIDDPSLTRRLVHTQIYTWNENFGRDLISNYGTRLPKRFLYWLSRRLLVAQVFLHSDHSGRILLTPTPDGRLRAQAQPSPDYPIVMAEVVRRLANIMSKAGVTALPFARRDGEPGSSFHVGGSLPMVKSPGPQQTDTLGRPFSHKRVHVVDASVLPSIPATTITFTVMANAHRIGSAAP